MWIYLKEILLVLILGYCLGQTDKKMEIELVIIMYLLLIGATKKTIMNFEKRRNELMEKEKEENKDEPQKRIRKLKHNKMDRNN